MDKIQIGLTFLIIGSIFYATRFISGAIGAVNETQWGKDEFSTYMSYVPSSLMVITIIALLIGVFFVIWGYKENNR